RPDSHASLRSWACSPRGPTAWCHAASWSTRYGESSLRPALRAVSIRTLRACGGSWTRTCRGALRTGRGVRPPGCSSRRAAATCSGSILAPSTAPSSSSVRARLVACERATAEALQVYQDARERLAEDLGIDPGGELTTIHRQLLAMDPALAGHAETRETTSVSPRAAPPPA